MLETLFSVYLQQVLEYKVGTSRCKSITPRLEDRRTESKKYYIKYQIMKKIKQTSLGSSGVVPRPGVSLYPSLGKS